ncbi:MAG: acyl-CoA dehydrogenase family protein, partial [Leptospira sp.]|nr:acyl-CoA dehydrogenase family protein [Leptospira sp.]
MNPITASKKYFDLFNPTENHLALRESVASFAEREMDEQAKFHDEGESFNLDLFKRLGSELGLFGITVPETDGGQGLDPLASVIIHEEMSRFDPGFTLSYLAHEVLFVNNFYYSSDSLQRKKYLEKVITGEWIGGMGMTEPGAGTDVLGMSTNA